MSPIDTKKKMVIVAGSFIVFVSLCYFIYRNVFYVSTDNATVQAHTLMLATKVPGTILQVNINENQKVKAGDLLIKIDDRDYANTLEQVESELASLQARLSDAEKNYRRVSSLYKQGALAQQSFDTAEAAYHELNRKVAALTAQVNQARLNVSYTEIKAPADGTISRKSAEIGMLAATGQPLAGFVEAKERWVDANFKETEIKEIQPGKKARVSVDAISGKTFEGVVESVSPSTGAIFTLLPPDNATGNFTKVVQRVPVRIKFVNLSAEDTDQLAAGLSADVDVKVR